MRFGGTVQIFSLKSNSLHFAPRASA